MRFTVNRKGFEEIAKHAIATEGVARMQDVADGCNSAADLDDGYRVSVEGDDPLHKHDFRATVITATAAAIRDNAKHNRLIQNFYRASG